MQAVDCGTRRARKAQGGRMPFAKWNLHDWVSRIFAGGSIGCAVLLLVDAAIGIASWPFKGHKNWEVFLFASQIGLPTAFVFGALVGLTWRRSRQFRLTLLEFSVCNWIVAIVSVLLIPAIAHVGPDSPRPLYQIVPQSMSAAFGLFALAGTVWLVGRQIGRWLRSRFSAFRSAS